MPAAKLNYQNARLELDKFVGKPITHELIKAIHAIVVGPEKEHQYRRGFGAPSVENQGKKVYLAPESDVYSLEEAVQNLLKKSIYDPKFSDVVALARFHWGFVKIHPFDEGNGRTARLLILLEMKNRGYDDMKCQRLEEYIASNRTQYYNALDDGNHSYVPELEAMSSRWQHYIQEAFDYATAKE